jgi:hypothetical protein
MPAEEIMFIVELAELLKRCPEGLPLFVMKNLEVRSETATPLREKDFGVTGVAEMSFVQTPVTLVNGCRWEHPREEGR